MRQSRSAGADDGRALDPLDETNRACERVARECYDAGIKAMNPANEVQRDGHLPGRNPLKAADCWSLYAAAHRRRAAFPQRPQQAQPDRSRRPLPGRGHRSRARSGAAGAAWFFAFEPSTCMAIAVSISAEPWSSRQRAAKNSTTSTTVTHKHNKPRRSNQQGRTFDEICMRCPGHFSLTLWKIAKCTRTPARKSLPQPHKQA